MLEPYYLAKRMIYRISAVLITGFHVLSAGFGVDLSTYVIHDQNAFQNYEEITDVIVQPSLSVSYSKSWKNTSVRTFYEGGYAHFQAYAQRVFQTHYGGLFFQQYLGDSGPLLSAGAQTGLRSNSDSLYTFYNYRHYIGHVNLRHIWNTWGMSLIGVWMQRRQYDKLPEFDYDESRFFIQQNFFLPSRTTLIARIQLGHKRFLESTVSENVVRQLVPRMDDPEAGNSGSRGQGGSERGRDSGDGSGDDNPGGGNGSGNGRGNSDASRSRSISQTDTTYDVVYQTVRVELPGKEVLQWKCSLRIAQSISSKTGLALEGRIQRRADGNGRLLSYQDSGYEDDDPLSDDPYNYDSDAFSLQWTQKLPWTLTFKGGWDSEIKHYNYRALDLSGEALSDSSMRRDNRLLIWATLHKQFSIGRIHHADVSVSYSYILNQSNEAYSDYQDRVFSFGWRLGL